MNRFLIISVCSFLIFSSCHYFHGEHIDGNGTIKKETRTVGVFNSVEVGGAIDVYVRQDSSRSVNIETDENLIPYVEIRNDGDVLYIHTKRGYNLDPSKSVKVYVSSPVYKMLQVSGASKIISENTLSSDGPIDVGLSGSSDAGLDLKCPKITVNVSGASTITVKGETKDLSIEGSGASHIKCFDLKSETVDVDVSGATSAEVFASVKLNAGASGASNVRYKGNAAVTEDESGASSVQKAD